MKYLMLIYGNQEKWASIPAEEWPVAIARQDAFNRKYQATGELIGAYGLADELGAKLVRRENGLPAVTDGPYLETKEYIASFYLLDCESEERALQIAADMPWAGGLAAAGVRWPADGIPENPRGWLVTVGSRRLMDQVRSEASRRTREELIAVATPQSELLGSPADAESTDRDDSLALLFGCCHPELSSPSQIALTLRAVGGLSTAQIAAAFGVPEATMAQRISRAKQTIRESGFDFSLPAGAERTERLRAVLHVLYLVFNEGYTASDGDELTVPALSREAIRLTRWLHRLLPQDAEVTGLLALMLLTDARQAARTHADGSLVPLAEQDRGKWDRTQIAEGTALIAAALPAGEPGPYQLQAAIAAVHDEATTMAGTDWPRSLALYNLLEHLAPNPFTTL